MKTKKSTMYWALCSAEGFFTHIAPATTADGGMKIVARTTRNPNDERIARFRMHSKLSNMVSAVEAAMATTTDELRMKSPFAGFAHVRVPQTVEITLPEPPPEVPIY